MGGVTEFHKIDKKVKKKKCLLDRKTPRGDFHPFCKEKEIYIKYLYVFACAFTLRCGLFIEVNANLT